MGQLERQPGSVIKPNSWFFASDPEIGLQMLGLRGPSARSRRIDRKLRRIEQLLAEPESLGLDSLSDLIMKKLKTELVRNPHTSSPSGNAVQIEQYTRVIGPREAEVAQLIAAGLTNTQIGKVLFIEGDTVKQHVSNLMDHLSLPRRDRTSIAVWYARLGLRIDEDPNGSNPSLYDLVMQSRRILR